MELFGIINTADSRYRLLSERKRTLPDRMSVAVSYMIIDVHYAHINETYIFII